ncbi:SseB family protein, partial [Streptomyces sp. NPDC006540]
MAELAGPTGQGELVEQADEPVAAPVEQPVKSAAAPVVDEVAAGRRRFARLLGEFRRAAVLVPFDAQGSLWTADFNG